MGNSIKVVISDHDAFLLRLFLRMLEPGPLREVISASDKNVLMFTDASYIHLMEKEKSACVNEDKIAMRMIRACLHAIRYF